MTINYTNLLGLAKPVTGTETGQWGDVVNDQITELIEDAVANASSISVTSGDVTLTTTTGSSNQARMAVLLITGSPGVSRNIIAPSQSKWYIVKNSSNASIVVKGSATTGVTILADTEALVFWNGSDFEVAGLVGPSSSTDNAVARFDSTTGKVIQNSGVTIDDSNNVSGVAQLNATTADLTNLEVTNIKAKDGTAAASIADSTGVISITSNPILSGGTANGVLYLNGSKVATSGSALTFDGTNFATTGTASATKLIPTGGSATGNGMYLPAANTLAWSNNGSETMRLDSSGNLGLGVTPSAWSSGFKTLELSFASSLTGHPSQPITYVGANYYYNGTNNIYQKTGYGAFRFDVDGNGAFKWYTAASGTAGNAISFTQAMTLDANGNFYVGTTSQSGGSNITFNQPANADMKIAASVSTGTRAAYQVFINTTVTTVGTENSTGGSLASGTAAYATVLANSGAYPVCFATNNTERMRLDSSGNLGIGTSSPGAKVHAYDTSNAKLLSQTTTGYAQFQASSTSGDFHIAIDNSTGAGFGAGAYSRLLYSTGAYPMVFSTNATERARITSGGDFCVSSTLIRSQLGSNTKARIKDASIGSVSNSGTGAIDTGISINQEDGGLCLLLLASRNVSAGVNTDSAMYIVRFYYNGNNAPTTTYVGGSSDFVTFGTSGSNTLTLTNASGGNASYSWFSSR